MTFAPTDAAIRDIAAHLGFELTDEEVTAYGDEIRSTLEAATVLEDYRTAGLSAQYPRSEVTRVDGDEDPLNTWITKVEVAGAADGPLADLDVGIKDNVSVAGVPLTCGSALLEDYVPTIDATVVSRLLDAGGRIVGKTNMDEMAYSGLGDTSAFGPTLNPHDADRLAGGSSGGSAVAVATGEVDVAIGTDQTGSIRAPAAWTGVVGHKPTHGLVPYTGCIGIEPTVDHVGPLAGDVRTIARTLSVLAGTDGLDPRQPATTQPAAYESSLDAEASTLSIAVLAEGFDRPGMESCIADRVQDTLDQLAAAGATVDRVSIPMHDHAHTINSVSVSVGSLAVLRGEGLGHNWEGFYDVDWVEAFSTVRRDSADAFPPGLKYTLVLGAYLGDRYPEYYAKAMNRRRRLERCYDEVLDNYDVIAFPTTPQRALRYDPANRRTAVPDIGSNLSNTCAANLTGHPAVSVPVKPVDGLPVGLQLTGSHFDDATVLRCAYTLEQLDA